jgi:hypothetical protein
MQQQQHEADCPAVAAADNQRVSGSDSDLACASIVDECATDAGLNYGCADYPCGRQRPIEHYRPRD